MLIEQVDRFDPKAPQRLVRHCLDVLRPAVEATATLSCRRVEIEAELRSDDDLALERRERFPYEFFVGERPIDFRCIEERHALFHGMAH